MRLLIASAILLFSFVLTCPAVIASPERSTVDAKRDVNSKPFAVLEFFGVQPGWTVIDLFAGNGYYSEAIAHTVGPQGRVYLHNNQAYMVFADKLNDRIADDRLPNVEVYIREVDAFDLEADSLDMAILVKAYHDVYFVQEGWNLDADALFTSIHRVLKPGGILAIIDHHAEPGSGKAAAQNLHRIDAAFAKDDIEGRGFRLASTSSLLENAQDDLQKSVFDPSINGRTSRFVYKFLKQ